MYTRIAGVAPLLATLCLLLPPLAAADEPAPPSEAVARFLDSAFGFCVAVTAHPADPVARAAERIPDGKLTGPAPLNADQDPWARRLKRLLDIRADDPVFVLTTPVPSQYRYHRAYARGDGKRCVVVTEQMPDAIDAAIKYGGDPANAFDLQYGGYQVRVYGRRATATDGPIAAWIPRVATQGTSAAAMNEIPLLVSLILAWETRDPGKGFPEFSEQTVLLTAAERDFARPMAADQTELWAGTVFDACFASALSGTPPTAEDFRGMLTLTGSDKASAPAWSSGSAYPGAVARTRKGAGGCSIELTAPLADQERVVGVWRRRGLALDPVKIRTAVTVGSPSIYTIKAKRPDGREKTVKLVIEPRYADSFYAIKISGG